MSEREYDYCSDKNDEYYEDIVAKAEDGKISSDKRDRLLGKLHEWEMERLRKGITK